MTVQYANDNGTSNDGLPKRSAIFNQIAHIFCDADPLRFVGGCEPEDYAPVVTTTLARLQRVQNVQDICNVVHEEFLRWFGVGITGPRDKYIPMAEKISVLLCLPIESDSSSLVD